MCRSMALVASVAAEWANYDVFWAVVHARSRDAALAAILGAEYASWRRWQQSQEETSEAAQERGERVRRRAEHAGDTLSIGTTRARARFSAARDLW